MESSRHGSYRDKCSQRQDEVETRREHPVARDDLCFIGPGVVLLQLFLNFGGCLNNESRQAVVCIVLGALFFLDLT